MNNIISVSCIICGEPKCKPRKDIPMTISGGSEILCNPFLCDDCFAKIRGSLIERFKKDFKEYFEQDEHICPDSMLKWLEDNI